MLLTHLLSSSAPHADVLDLLPHPAPSPAPPVCPGLDSHETDALWARFENNNFVVHSHLDPLAAGVYPAASRALNHSCAPNAVPLFLFRSHEPPSMHVVLVHDVRAGDEVRGPSSAVGHGV